MHQETDSPHLSNHSEGTPPTDEIHYDSPLFSDQLVTKIARIMGAEVVQTFDSDEHATTIWQLYGDRYDLMLLRYNQNHEHTVSGDAELSYKRRRLQSPDHDIMIRMRGVSSVHLHLTERSYVTFTYTSEQQSHSVTLSADGSAVIDSEERLRPR